MINAANNLKEMTSNSSQEWLIDLSNASDVGLELVLLRVSGTDLLKRCAQVSRKWNRILTQKSFWIAKAELDGYKLEWPRLAALSVRAYQAVAMSKPFGRNFIQDSWDLGKQDGSCWQKDTRWSLASYGGYGYVDPLPLNRPHSRGNIACIEVPPVFMDGQPKANAEIGEPPDACLATSCHKFTKQMTIKLADEGLTDEIMDELRPTLIITELVANRRDCASQYRMECQLSDVDPFLADGGANQTVELETMKAFAQWEAEGWHRVECVFRNYPAGMRYLHIDCSGRDSQFWAGNYGVKMARCRVEAICERNRNIGENDGTIG